MTRCKTCAGTGKYMGVGFITSDCLICDGTGKTEDNEKLREANPAAYDKAIDDLQKADKTMSKEDAVYYLAQSVNAKKKKK